MGIEVGGIGVDVTGIAVSVIMTGAETFGDGGAAQAVINNRRIRIFWRMDIFYPFVYNAKYPPR
jgi:hypothetical protein